MAKTDDEVGVGVQLSPPFEDAEGIGIGVDARVELAVVEDEVKVIDDVHVPSKIASIVLFKFFSS